MELKEIVVPTAMLDDTGKLATFIICAGLVLNSTSATLVIPPFFQRGVMAVPKYLREKRNGHYS